MANKKVAIDFGHYKCDSGAVYKWNGKSVREVDLVEDMGRACEKGLKRSKLEVLVTYGSLTNRSNMANNWLADIFVSIHTNAGGGDGTEVFYSPNSRDKGSLARKVLENILEDKLNNSRGVKTANFSVLRNTNMTACLVEAAFGDNQNDCKAIDELHERVAFGEAIAEGICEYLGVKYVQPNESKPQPPKPSTPPQPSKPQGNTWVLKLQKELNKQGYKDKNGKKLVEDGLAGSATLSACPTLRKGAKGNVTKLMQEKLNSLGYSTNGVDGIFGNGSYNAVKKFQSAKKLVSDGIVGQGTWKKLLGL